MLISVPPLAGPASMRRLLPILLWLTLPLSALAASPTRPPLPDDWIELIRSGHHDAALALGQRDLSQLDHAGSGNAPLRCTALDRIARLLVFDNQDPDIALQEHLLNQAIACHRALPAGPDKAAILGWLTLRLYSRKAEDSGQLERRDIEIHRAEAELLRDGARLPVFDRMTAYVALADIAGRDGDFALAIRRYREAIAAVDENDWLARAARASAQARLGGALERTGQYASAIDAGELALRWIKETFVEGSLREAGTVSALAQTEFFSGRYADSLEHAERGIDIARSAGPHGERVLAFALTVKGNGLRVTGELERARDALTEALTIERGQATSGPGVLAVRLNQLGSVEQLLNGCTSAMPHYREALALSEAQFGADNVRITPSLMNNGKCERELGQFAEATLLFVRARAISEHRYGPRHAQVADSRIELADIALQQRNYASAATQLKEAIALLPTDTDAMATLGIGAHRRLAQALHGSGRDEEAFAEAVVAEGARQLLLRRIGATLDENNALAFTGHLVGALDIVLALAARNPKPDHVTAAWQLQIGARQLVTGLVAARLRAARQSAHAAGDGPWRDFNDASHAYADAVIAHETGKVDAATMRARSDSLDRASRVLARRFGAAAQPLAPTPTIVTLQRALGASDALIGFAMEGGDYGADPARIDTRHLYALRLQHEGVPRLSDLGDVAPVNAAIRDWTEALRDPRRGHDLASLGAKLVQLTVDPLELSTSVRRVFIVAEGDLHRIAWLALPQAGTTWVESGMIPQLLDSERELIATPSAPLNLPRLLLVGPPPVDVRQAEQHPACPQGTGELLGAELELAALRSIWRTFAPNAPVRVLTGHAATKQDVLSEAARSRTLHFATHAFAGDSPCLPSLMETRGVRLTASSSSHPLGHRSNRDLNGLVLASVEGEDGRGDNGILAASEIAAMNLDGVDGVTLAACDTGLGPVLPDEGVFGLARAFRIAGARSVVMSLWSVDDAATGQLMQQFYRARIGESLDAASALARAARETLAARRRAGLSDHPYYWAGFVASEGRVLNVPKMPGPP